MVAAVVAVLLLVSIVLEIRAKRQHARDLARLEDVKRRLEVMAELADHLCDENERLCGMLIDAKRAESRRPVLKSIAGGKQPN